MLKRICLLFTFLFVLNSAFGQGGTWTWISGSTIPNDKGHYGTQGIPSISNYPPGMYVPSEWKDKQGNLWVYGGWNIANNEAYSDLWKYNPKTNEWTWVKGNGQVNQQPIHGQKGIANPNNNPGVRMWGTATWVDTAGNLWMYGGSRADLWKYNININQWIWMNGDSSSYSISAHGINGIPSVLNSPGTRSETNSAWTDSSNNLWLFGGSLYYDDSLNGGEINDLWKYNISTNEWTWMNGSKYINDTAVYGVKGIGNAANHPEARASYIKWKDKEDNFWIMGGYHSFISNSNLYFNLFNDVWKYNPNNNEWAWVSGTKLFNDSGHYQSYCTNDSSYTPYSRYENRASATDNCGKFWLFGGSESYYNHGLHDLWVFDPYTLKWNLLSGDNGHGPGHWGTLGVPSSANIPPALMGSAAWWSDDNQFYIFGGLNFYQSSYNALVVFNPDPDCVSVCGSTIASPIANFQSAKTTSCTNDCVTFSNLSTNALTYSWVFSGGSPSSSNNQNPQVCYQTPGTYDVTLIASNSAGSDTLILSNYITVQASPPPPTILDHIGIGNDTLIFNSDPSYISYQWYKDNNPIAGATDTVLVIYQNGNYNVEVTNANGCKTAVGINVIIGVQNYMKDNTVILSPNPVATRLTIDNGQTIESLYIYNTLGMLIRKSEIVNRTSKIEIDVSDLSAGVYFIHLLSEKERWTGRFIKE